MCIRDSRITEICSSNPFRKYRSSNRLALLQRMTRSSNISSLLKLRRSLSTSMSIIASSAEPSHLHALSLIHISTRLIGTMCKWSDPFSKRVLIGRGLDHNSLETCLLYTSWQRPTAARWTLRPCAGSWAYPTSATCWKQVCSRARWLLSLIHI